MRLKEVTRALASGVVVYVLMAACAADPIRDRNLGRAEATGTGGVRNDAGDGTSGNASAGEGSGGMLAELDAMVDAVGDAVTDPVPDADADPATSGERLRARYYVGEDGSRQFLGWYDSERDETCAFQQAEDGKIRCLPTFEGYGMYYTNSTCTEAVAVVAKESSTCPGTSAKKPTYIVDYKVSICEGMRLLSVGASITPATLYIGGVGTCTATTASDTVNYYAAEHVPASSFVEASIEVE